MNIKPFKTAGFPLHWKILISILLGFVYAFIAASYNLNTFTNDWIKPFGIIFTNLLKLIAIPLVLCSIIVGIVSINITNFKKIGLLTITLYLATTIVSVSLGLTLVNVISPGKGIDKSIIASNYNTYKQWAERAEAPIKTSYLPYSDTNSIQKKKLLKSEDLSSFSDKYQKKKESSPLQFLINIVPSNLFASLSNNSLMIQIIFFAIFFGLVVTGVENRYKSVLITFIEALNQVFLKMIDKIMRYSPWFIFCLTASSFSNFSSNEIGSVLYSLLNYSIVVILGLFIMVFVLYPLILKLLAKTGYKQFFKTMAPAQLLAFSSSSSAATLPVTIGCVKRLGVSSPLSNFVLPIGATINMDGTSLYQSIAVVYLAHIHGIDLSILEQIIILLSATLASIGSAAVPSGGIVLLMMVLETVGLNAAWIAFILPVDRVLDMCRTVANVSGDALVAKVVSRFSKE